MKKTEKKAGQSVLFKVITLSLPFILVSVSIVILSLWLFNNAIAASSTYQLIAGSIKPDSTEYLQLTEDQILSLKEQNEGMYVPAHFPIITYAQQWATLTIEAAGVDALPVHSGESPDFMKLGAAHSFNSRYCGQNGLIVLSAHVTGVHGFFGKLETLKPGSKVLMNTIYGPYEYVVTQTVIFDETDSSFLHSEDGKEILFCYTCYPRVTTKKRTQRFGIICEKVSGKNWIEEGGNNND